MFNKENKKEEDFGKTVWGKILLEELLEEILDGEKRLIILKNKMINFKELDKYVDVILRDIDVLRNFENAINVSWDRAFEYLLEEFSFERWPADKKITISLKDEAKDIRGDIKKKIKNACDKILLYNSKEAYEDIFAMYDTLNNLKNLVFEFREKFSNEKREKNLLDFNDIEHYALEILVKKDENGNLIKTETAKKYTEKFSEIAIDEYQDSNRIQEQILTAISNGKNIFMVGDVKQSIYKFRRACPELFLEKYENYDLNGNKNGIKIKLFKNFRSRKNIIDFTNNVFESIMSKSLGDIEYDKDEFLNLGAEFEENNEMEKSEVYVIDTGKKESEEFEENELDLQIKQMEREDIESKFVAKKIRKMIDNKILVADKKIGKRPIKYKDIVILSRSTKIAETFERELIKNNIPVFTDSGSEYLESVEINTMINLLKILDNPLDDIPLVSVLRSMLFKFTDNEIIEIRLVDRNTNFWNTILEAVEKLENEKLKEKLKNFIFKTQKWRNESEYKPISELIWEIYVETGFLNYVSLMPNGAFRKANLKMLFERAKDYEKTSFKGLFNFIRFIEKLKSKNSDLSSAKIIGENEDVVRIMSIHKSKGLEFPIVFLCNSNKKINFDDLKGDILFHQDIGVGPEYINYERRIEFSTAAKQAIKLKLKKENISEEMRILYVAFTRAKEKLIITAVKNDEENKLIKEKEEVVAYIKENKINPILLKKCNSYLDWIEFVHLKNEILNGKNEIFNFNVLNAKNILEEKQDESQEKLKIDFSQYNNFEEIEKKLNWEYSDIFKTTLPIKSTVSTIKELEQNEIDFFELGKENIGLAKVKPNFLKDEKITASRIGTLTHLVLQKIDFNKIKTEEDLVNFINSDFALRIKSSKKIYKEKPFFMKINASRVFKQAKDEEILVQGIIDLFFEDENGDIILVDYKTDYVAYGNEDILIQKYKVQLELYKKAVEEFTKKSVKETYLYSLYLNKALKL